MIGDSLISKLQTFRPRAAQGKAMTADELEKTFLEQYATISTDDTVRTALCKIFKIVRQSVTSQEAALKYAPDGSGIVSIEAFYAGLGKEVDLTEEEKLAIVFMPVDKFSLNLEQLNIGLFFEVLHLAKSIGSVAVKQNKTKI